MSYFDFAGKKCALKCPACGGQDLNIDEVWDGNGIHFSIRDGVMPGEADDHFQGAPVRLHCECVKCKRTWTPRKARTMWEAFIDEEAEQEKAS